MINEGRVPPYNAEAEVAILGSVLLRNECWGEVYSIVDTDDFYVDSHRRIFDNMYSLIEEGIPVDHVTLGNRLRQNGELDKVGGAIALSGLTDSVSTTANVSHYADIVREASGVRKVIWSAQEVAANGFRCNNSEGLDQSIEKLIAATQYLAKKRMPDSLFSLGEKVLDNYKLVASGWRGIELPWKSLDNMTAGLWPKTVTMFVARPGVGKCVAEDTMICDASDGAYRTVKEVVEERRAVFTRGDSGRILAVVPDAFLDTGSKRCLRVTLASGREISVTPEHPLYSIDGWRRADEFSVGDYVEVAREIPEPLYTKAVASDDVVLLAALLAEGEYTHDQVTFTNGDEEMIAMVKRAAGNIGADLIKTKGMKPFEWKLVWNKDICCGRGRNLGPNPVRVLLDAYGCGHVKSSDKVIPGAVFGWSNKDIAKFLGVFWGGDGSVGSGGITVTLASKEMVFQIQRLLLRLGILSCVQYKPVNAKGRVFDSWRLRVYSSCAGRFAELIDPVVDAKRKALSAMEDSKNPSIDNVPITSELASRLSSLAYDSLIDKASANKDVAKLLGRSDFSPNELWRRKTVSRRLLGAFLKVYGGDELITLLRNTWDEVVSVEDDGVRRVYDLTVIGTHNFLANDIMAHNTFVATIIARHAWMKEKRVLILSPEMGKDEIAERFFVVDAKMNYHHVVTGDLPTKLEKRYEENILSYREKDGLYIMDSDDDLSPKGIDAAIRACNPDLVACDSMYDLKIKGDRKDRLLTALEWLKTNSKEHGYAAVSFAQQNRVAELSEKKGGGSRLGTIALADEIGQDAQTVIALEQTKDDKADGIMKFRPLKIRRGQVKRPVIKTYWKFDVMDFAEIEEKESKYKHDDIPF